MADRDWLQGRSSTHRSVECSIWEKGISPRLEANVAHMAAFLAKLPQLVKDGLAKPLPIKLWEGGFAAVPDGLQYMREGKVSAEKIVYRV